MMPFLSGIEVCRALRSMNETRMIPIIMLSARGEEGDKTLGLDVGADDYISKPFFTRWSWSRGCALSCGGHVRPCSMMCLNLRT